MREKKVKEFSNAPSSLWGAFRLLFTLRSFGVGGLPADCLPPSAFCEVLKSCNFITQRQEITPFSNHKGRTSLNDYSLEIVI
jgi:hypothetical protein